MGVILFILGLVIISTAYIYTNDQKLLAVPPEAAKQHQPLTDEDVRKAMDNDNTVDLKDYLGERTDRRYVIVGGAGFLGGWIVLHLLERGESPSNIRIFDIRRPTRPDIISLLDKTPLSFVKTDITNPDSVRAAFETPWPSSADTRADITVFHTAAILQFYERHKRLLPSFLKVNVDGPKNVLEAAKATGDVTVFIYTSSGSIGIRDTRFLLWPWEKKPRYHVQKIDDSEPTNGILPSQQSEFFSNYPYSKYLADRFVGEADMSITPSGKPIRTGCIRPSNGVYGPAGDTIIGPYMDNKSNPSFDHQTVTSFIYVENCSLGHLAYERTLLSDGLLNKGVGGRSYCITDGGPTPTYDDTFRVITEGTNGEVTFPKVSPTLMILLSHVIECVYLAKRLAPSPLSSFLPDIPPILYPLQPPVFPLTVVHAIFDDSRARKEIGYRTPWTTATGTWETVKARTLKGEGKGHKVVWRGVGGGVPLGQVQTATAKVVDKLRL